MFSTARIRRDALALRSRIIAHAIGMGVWLGLSLLATSMFAHSARADVMFSNFDDTTVWAFGGGVAWNQPTLEWESAMRFVPSFTGTVDDIVVPVFTEGAMGVYVPQPPPGTVFGDSMKVALYADNNGEPGALLELVDAPNSVPLWDSVTPPMPPPVTVAFSGTTSLQGGQAYWLGLIETEATALLWMFSHSMPETPRLIRTSGSPEWQSAGLITQSGLQVHGTPVPGPAGAAALGLLALASSGRRRA